MNNVEAIEKLILDLAQRFEGIDELMGSEYNFEALSHQLYFLESARRSDPLALLSLATEVAVALIETGLFELRVYSQTRSEAWNPLKESLASFRARSKNVSTYQDGQSLPGLIEVNAWVDGFLKG